MHKTKKIFIFYFLICISSIAFSQPSISLSKTLGGAGAESIQDLITDNQGHIIALCRADSNNQDVNCNLHGKNDIWLVKMDEDCNILWQKCYGGSEDEFPYQIIETADGGYLFVSTTFSNDGDITGYHGNQDIWVVKTDSDGNLQWQKTVGSTGGEYAYDLIQLKNNRYILSCFTLGGNGDFPEHYGVDFNVDAWLVFISPSGTIDTTIRYGGSDHDYITEIIELSNGDLQMFGYTASTDFDLAGTTAYGSVDGWFLKTDSNGKIKNQQKIGYSGPDEIVGAVRLNNGYYLTAGDGSTDIWVLKLDSLGNKVAEYYYGGSMSETMDYQRRIFATGNGYFTLGARSTSYDGDVGYNHGFGWDDYWFFTIDSNGLLINSKVAGGTAQDELNCNVMLHPNVALLGGYTTSSDGDIVNYHGNSDGWLVKIEGFDQVNSINIKKDSVYIFPNPAKENVTVEFDDGIDFRNASLQIFSFDGSLVLKKKINHEEQVISVERLSASVYLYIVLDKNQRQIVSGKLIVQ